MDQRTKGETIKDKRKALKEAKLAKLKQRNLKNETDNKLAETIADFNFEQKTDEKKESEFN